MTADVELLPLPEDVRTWLSSLRKVNNNGSAEHIEAWFQRYARANVEHHTEALRAEVEKIQAFRKHHRARHKSYKRRHADAVARSERLAEALRSILEYIEEGGYGFEYTCERVARAALHPTAAQEGE